MSMKEFYGKFVVVLVYADDILIASIDDDAIIEVKIQLSSTFQVRDLGPSKFFFGIEIAKSSDGISLSPRNYMLWICYNFQVFLVASHMMFLWNLSKNCPWTLIYL